MTAEEVWADMRTAPREHMALSFAQRRERIAKRCWQLKQDADSYNENYNPGEPIVIVFDFRNDIAELASLEVGQ